ncbi:MAG TPA: cytochrome P450 [Candidatus Limnocylindria bacterium]|jgi:cytochrome P450|nr:cytochrome P450 [Candidatus Limnocylindria bacterium]
MLPTLRDLVTGKPVNLFSDDVRRDPYPVYDRMRSQSPLLYLPAPFDGWLIFDYDGAKRALNDHEAFSSAVPAPPHWFIFIDPPAHTKFRALISRAFTPRMVANLEPLIRDLSRELLDRVVRRGEMDMAADFSVPLPMRVIATMIGIPADDWPRFKRWSDGILKLSYARSGGQEAQDAGREFRAVTAEMSPYLEEMIRQRRAAPQNDLLTRLIESEVDGERLSHGEILGFFQLLIVGGQETTTNLLNNAILCFVENPDQLALLRRTPELLPSAIEEVLRYRSPLQWVMRTPRRDTEIHGQTIPAGKLVLPMIGSANRDPNHFKDANRFDIRREPNPHIAFGHGIHSCLGAALARMEARIALADFLARVRDFKSASTEPWQPRRALHVHGPEELPIRFTTT